MPPNDPSRRALPERIAAGAVMAIVVLVLLPLAWLARIWRSVRRALRQKNT